MQIPLASPLSIRAQGKVVEPSVCKTDIPGASPGCASKFQIPPKYRKRYTSLVTMRDRCKSGWRISRLTHGLSSRREMNDKAKWRMRLKTVLERHFQKHSFPKIFLGVILILTGLFGFGISVLLLQFGVDQMWIRYPVAVIGAYGGFLALIRIWVEVERRRFDPQESELQEALKAAETSAGPTHLDSGRRSSWLDWLDVPDFTSFDIDEGCLPAILLAALIGLVVVLFFALVNAPVLLAEVFLDAFLVSVLYRRLQIAAKEHWLGTAIRKTWLLALAVAALLAIAGWGLETFAPGSRSFGPAIRQLWD